MGFVVGTTKFARDKSEKLGMYCNTCEVMIFWKICNIIHNTYAYCILFINKNNNNFLACIWH